MNENWKNVVITEIGIAVYVAPNSGNHVHKNRPMHGFVLNDSENNKNYIFSDGRILNTAPNALFYLPKGSSYYVESESVGGCFAINFNADISDEPFSVTLRNPGSLTNLFKAAADAWRSADASRWSLSMRALYEAIYRLQKGSEIPYVPKSKIGLIAPAIEKIRECFASGDLSVSYLAGLCNISEVYFRKIFFGCFGKSPKEYIIQKRIEYAKNLLRSGDFSVSEVALMCGYAEPCHFSKEFSKYVGISPSKYHDSIGGKNERI